MNRWVSLILLFSVIFSTVGCVDSSPLKSDLEASLNTTFKMNFDYLDKIEIYQTKSKLQSNDDSLIASLDEEQTRKIGLGMAQAEEVNQPKPDSIEYRIILSTSTSKLEYNKKQTRADMVMYERNNRFYLFYNNKSYLLPNEFKDELYNLDIKLLQNSSDAGLSGLSVTAFTDI